MRSARRQTIASVLAFTLVLAMETLLLSPAVAEQHRPCAEDVRRLCQNIQPRDRQAVDRCLGEHKDELSSACRDRIQTIMRWATAVREACGQDVQTFCGDVRPGGGRVGACLMRHREELSESCRKALGQARRKREDR